MGLKLPVQSMSIATKVVSSNPVHGKVYSIQHCVISRLVTGHISNWKLTPLKYFNATGINWLVFSMNLDSTKSLNYLKKYQNFIEKLSNVGI